MVKWYWKCNGCGSMVIHYDNGTIKFVTEKYIKDNNIDLTNAVRVENSYHKCEMFIAEFEKYQKIRDKE